MKPEREDTEMVILAAVEQPPQVGPPIPSIS